MVKPTLSCEICQKEYSTERSLKQHNLQHLSVKPFKCSECESSFTQKSKLIEHLNRHKGTPPYSCSLCEKRFYQKDRLKTHNLTHTGERPFECEICGLGFRRKFELNKHCRLHNEKVREQLMMFVCNLCGKKNYSRADLERHKLKHSDIRNFKCDMCSSAFKDKYTLQSHKALIHYTTVVINNF